MKGPPRRLLDDPSTSAGLSEDLAHAASTPSRAVDASAGLARLRSAIDAGGAAAPAGGAAASTGATSSSVAVGLGVAVLAGAGLIAAIWWLADDPASDVPSSGSVQDSVSPGETGPRPDDGPSDRVSADRISADRVSADRVSADPGHETAPSEASALVSSDPEPGDAPSPDLRHAATAQRESPGTDPDELLRLEMAQLVRIRALLESQPAAALRLADEGQRVYRGGMFSEEREALAIFALAQLGRRPEVRRRGARFLDRHPRGPFSPEVRRLLEAP